MSQARNFSINDIRLIPINNANMPVYINLARSYEAEFSSLTHKNPNELGIFEPDTIPVSPYIGYLLYNDKTPIGFCIVGTVNKFNDIAEFYIVPSMRKNKFGYNMAATVFDLHPGAWQVRQIDGATNAIEFWRKVIKQYTQNNFVEAIISDPHWGIVTRQQFVSNEQKLSNDSKIQPHESLPRLSIFGYPDAQASNHIPTAASSLKPTSG